MGGGRPGNDPEAYRDNTQLPDTVVWNCQLLDLAADAFGDADRGAQFGVRHEHQEFLAAITDREIAVTAQLAGDGGGDAFEAGVAGDMALAVVETLEVVDVEHDHGGGGNRRFTGP